MQTNKLPSYALRPRQNPHSTRTKLATAQTRSVRERATPITLGPPPPWAEKTAIPPRGRTNGKA